MDTAQNIAVRKFPWQNPTTCVSILLARAPALVSLYMMYSETIAQ